MPRYFFHVSLEGTLIEDPNGQVLPNADAAWERARQGARTLMRSDLGRPVNWLTCHFEVADAAGHVVLEFPFAEAVEIEPPH
ncbi:MAG TPA: hypothetical protein VHL98_14330 [Microvirga sp.]|jgi:hypothetical protein|nr:hypothetical protein [Microvirga sp.]